MGTKAKDKPATKETLEALRAELARVNEANADEDEDEGDGAADADDSAAKPEAREDKETPAASESTAHALLEELRRYNGSKKKSKPAPGLLDAVLDFLK